jgi:hypothetical protein
LPALCSVSCDSGNNCGPTSDWPTCANGDETAGNGDDNGASSPPSRDPDHTKKDAGAGKTTHLDAGAVLTPGCSSCYDGVGGADAGDAGADAGDARVQSIDGGAPCTIDSDRRDAGLCYGVYCEVPQSSFVKLASDKSVSSAACLDANDLSLACDGEISRVVAACTQDDVLSLGFGRTVAICAARAPSLSLASDACIDCYVDEMLCALENCLAPCLSDASSECTSCRREHCESDFSSCSGLPNL